MSKNKKIVFASVSILFALISAVLLIRHPMEKVALEPPSQQVVTPHPQETPSKEMSESQAKVAEIIDDVSAAVVKETPGMLARVKDTWDWLMGFDTKRAIILISVMVFVFGLLATGNHRGSSKRNTH